MKFQPIANSLRSAQWQDHVGASVSGLRAWRQSGFRPSTIPAALPESRIQLEETTALLPPFLILLSLFSRFFCTSKACRGLTASRARGVQWAHCTSCLCKRNTYERYLTGGKRSSYQKYPSHTRASTSRVDLSNSGLSVLLFPRFQTLAYFATLNLTSYAAMQRSGSALEPAPPLPSRRARSGRGTSGRLEEVVARSISG